jgi:hypothetical protein
MNLLQNIIDSNGKPISLKNHKILAIQQIDTFLCEITTDKGIAYIQKSLEGYIAQIAMDLIDRPTYHLMLLKRDEEGVKGCEYNKNMFI